MPVYETCTVCDGKPDNFKRWDKKKQELVPAKCPGCGGSGVVKVKHRRR